MKLIGLLVFVFAMLSAVCATSIPKAENFLAAKQKKAMAAQHWGVIAADAVKQTQLALSQQTFAKNKPLYVADNTTTDFNRAFRKYVIAGLIDAGLPVSSKKDGAIELSYETQVIRHASSFEPQTFGYKPGMASAGVFGFWVLRNAFQTWSVHSAGLATVAAAGAYDVYSAVNPGETGVELLISTSIIHDDRYLMLNADAYYIEKGEAWLFEGCKGKNRRNCR